MVLAEGIYPLPIHPLDSKEVIICTQFTAESFPLLHTSAWLFPLFLDHWAPPSSIIFILSASSCPFIFQLRVKRAMSGRGMSQLVHRSEITLLQGFYNLLEAPDGFSGTFDTSFLVFKSSKILVDWLKNGYCGKVVIAEAH
jgi:hypothetical protein